MFEDPIVEEVRRIRDERARRFNYDVHAIFADLMERQKVEDPAHPLVKNAAEHTRKIAVEKNSDAAA